MSENNEEIKTTSTTDKELEDLLDSTLEDMTASQTKKKDVIEQTAINPTPDGGDWNPAENVWSEEFLQQAAATFESNMAALLSSMKGCSEESISQDQIAATFQMMAEAAAQVMKPSVAADDGTEDPELEEGDEKPKAFTDVNAAISTALESLNVNADNLQNQNAFSDEDIKNMFAGLNLDGQENPDNMFVPFMKDMMQSLLSKEVLYPSLKEIVDKYPDWLSGNKGKLSTEDFNKYSKQYELMNKVCIELEQESDSDSEEVKKVRFDKVVELMQQMQELGQPPEDLVGENPQVQAPPAMPQIDPNQCKPM